MNNLKDLENQRSYLPMAATEIRPIWSPEILKKEIKDDTKFNYQCSMCGNCCVGADQVQLNTHDIFQIMKSPIGVQIGTTHALFNEKNNITQVHINTALGLPVVTLDKPCGFLCHLQDPSTKEIQKNDLDLPIRACSLQDFRPYICKLYPIQTIYSGGLDLETNELEVEEKHLWNPLYCQHKKDTEEYTLATWIEKNKLQESLKWNRWFREHFMKLVPYVPQMDEALLGRVFNIFFNINSILDPLPDTFEEVAEFIDGYLKRK